MTSPLAQKSIIPQEACGSLKYASGLRTDAHWLDAESEPRRLFDTLLKAVGPLSIDFAQIVRRRGSSSFRMNLARCRCLGDWKKELRICLPMMQLIVYGFSAPWW